MKTETAVKARRTDETPSVGRTFGTVDGVALALAAVTGALHLSLYVTDSWLPFLAAGLGFLGWMGLYVALPRYRRAVAVGGILFTVAQIAGYLLFPMGPLWLGVLDKAVQVALVAVLATVVVRGGSVGRATEPVEGVETVDSASGGR